MKEWVVGTTVLLHKITKQKLRQLNLYVNVRQNACILYEVVLFVGMPIVPTNKYLVCCTPTYMYLLYIIIFCIK